MSNSAAKPKPPMVVEGSDVRAEQVSEDFIRALDQAGARKSLVSALREERRSDRPPANVKK